MIISLQFCRPGRLWCSRTASRGSLYAYLTVQSSSNKTTTRSSKGVERSR